MLVLFWVLFSVAVGILANNRGRSGFGWFLLSLLISPLLSLLFVAVLKNLSAPATQPAPSLQTHVKCTACAEFVLPEAKVCKHCGATLIPDPGFSERSQKRKDAGNRADQIALWIWAGVIAAIFVALASLTRCVG